VDDLFASLRKAQLQLHF